MVRRPLTASRSGTKPQKSSLLRTSFAPDTFAQDSGDEDVPSTTAASAAAAPKRVGPNRLVLGRAAEALGTLPFRADSRSDRPNYSADYLAELKSSTPSTPRPPEVSTSAELYNDTDNKLFPALGLTQALTTLDAALPSIIPTNAEIREKKERRRRLKHEQDFISLDADAPAGSASGSDEDDASHLRRTLILPADEVNLPSKYGESRLTRDDEDEDMAEGFDDFVEDAGRVALSRRGRREQERARRRQIETQIRGDDDNEGSSVDEEEVARTAAYEAAQTRAGTYGTRMTGAGRERESEREREARWRRRMEPPKVVLVPELKSAVARLVGMVIEKEEALAQSRRQLDLLEMEGKEIDEEEVRVKELLREAGDRLEKLSGQAVAADVPTEDPSVERSRSPAQGSELQVPDDMAGLLGDASFPVMTKPAPGSMASMVRRDEYDDSDDE